MDISRETVELLARVQRIEVPEEDLDALTAAFRDHLAAVAAIDERYDLADIEPPLVFDPRWR